MIFSNCGSDARKPRARAIAVLAGALLVSACQGDSILAPREGGANSVWLSATTQLLTSLGDTLRLKSLVRDATGAPAPDVPMRWQLSAPGILEPLGNGLFRAVGNGRVTIRATVDPSATGVRPSGYFANVSSDSMIVNVQQAPAYMVALSVDTLYTMIGVRRAVGLQVTDARGHEIERDVLSVAYEMMDPRVATVDGAGVVRSVEEGRTELVATARTAAGATTWRAPVNVRPRATHTSCMNFTQRRQARKSCVTSDFVVHASREVTP